MLSPFQIRFISDDFEFVPESMKSPNGFQLAYILKSCAWNNFINNETVWFSWNKTFAIKLRMKHLF